MHYVMHILYRVMCWEKSTEAVRVLYSHKRILRLIFNVNDRNSLRNLFMFEGLLTFSSLYIYKYLLLAHEHHAAFVKNNTNHLYNTRNLHSFRV